MCKTVYWDLINSNINKRVVQEGCFAVNKLSLVNVMRPSLSLGGKKLLLSLSVFAIMLLKRLPDGSKMKRRLRG